MTQLEIDEAVAAATKESLTEIRRRGFSIADRVELEDEPEWPHAIDWDELDAQRRKLFP